MSLESRVEQITSRSELASFVAELAGSIATSPEDWENSNLADFLLALSGWLADMDGYFENHSQAAPNHPSWRLVGEMLLAARIYE